MSADLDNSEDFWPWLVGDEVDTDDVIDIANTTFVDSGPVWAAIEDPWNWFNDDLEDDDLTAIVCTDEYQQWTVLYQDEWDYSVDDGYDDDLTELVNTVDKSTYGLVDRQLEDAFDWYGDDDAAYDDTLDIILVSFVDPGLVDRQIEDAWDFSLDEHALPSMVFIDSYLQSDNERATAADETWIDWEEYSDEFRDWYVESAPVGANLTTTALLIPEEPWDFNADDAIPGMIYVESYLQRDNIQPPVGSDDWDWTNDDAVPNFSLVESYQQIDIGSNPVSGQLPEDAWDWTIDDALPSGAYVESYQQRDVPQVGGSAGLTDDQMYVFDEDPEDFFADHFSNIDVDELPQPDSWYYEFDSAEEDWYVDPDFSSANLPLDLIPHWYGDEAEIWFVDDTEDDISELANTAAVVSDVLANPAQIVELDWDWNEDTTDDLETELFVLTNFVPPPPSPINYDDDFYLFTFNEDDVEDFFTEDFVTLSIIDYIQDAWAWEFDDSDDTDDDMTEMTDNVPNIDTGRLQEDAWDWTEEIDDELLLAIDSVSLDTSFDVNADDQVDWTEEVEDDWSMWGGEPLSVDFAPQPIQQFSDEWWWTDEEAAVIEDAIETEIIVGVPVTPAPSVLAVIQHRNVLEIVT